MSLSSSLLSNRPDMGKHSVFHYDEATGLAHIETFTEVGGMMERNKAKFNSWSAVEQHGDLIHVGSIPLAKYFWLKKQGVIDDLDPQQLRFRQWCRDNYAEYSSWFCVPKGVL